MPLLRIWLAFRRLGCDHIWPCVAMGMVFACVACFLRFLIIGASVARSVATIALSSRLLASVLIFRLAAVTVYPTSAIYCGVLGVYP